VVLCLDAALMRYSGGGRPNKPTERKSLLNTGQMAGQQASARARRCMRAAMF